MFDPARRSTNDHKPSRVTLGTRLLGDKVLGKRVIESRERKPQAPLAPFGRWFGGEGGRPVAYLKFFNNSSNAFFCPVTVFSGPTRRMKNGPPSASKKAINMR